MNDFKRLFDIPFYQLNKFPKQDSVCGKQNGQWKLYSSQDVIGEMNRVSEAALSFGLQKGDTVAIISGNRPEWNFIDLGMMQIGVVMVPVYPNISEADCIYIFNDAKVKMVFVSNAELFTKVISIDL